MPSVQAVVLEYSLEKDAVYALSMLSPLRVQATEQIRPLYSSHPRVRRIVVLGLCFYADQ